jgi:hypothetical protein
MPHCCGMLGCMLAWRTVAASDVPAFRAPAKMEPPTFRRRQAFHTPISAWLRSGVDSALISLHFRFVLTFDVTSSVFQVTGRWIVNSAPCVRAYHTPLTFFQAAARLRNWTMVLAMLRFAGTGERVCAPLFWAMCPIRTFVLVDTFVQ